MYRNDIFERTAYIMKDSDKEDIRPNFAKLAKSLGCDNGKSRPPRPSKLDPYRSAIQEKL